MGCADPLGDGQPPRVGRGHRDRIGRQFAQHPPQGVARAFRVRREHRPLDELPQVVARQDVILLGVEVGDAGELGGIGRRQLVLRTIPPDPRSLVARLDDNALPLQFPRMDDTLPLGRSTSPGCWTSASARRCRTPTSWSVPMRIASPAAACSLTFCRIGLGVRDGTTPLTVANAAAIAAREHFTFMRGNPEVRRDRDTFGDTLLDPPKFRFRPGERRETVRRERRVDRRFGRGRLVWKNPVS